MNPRVGAYEPFLKEAIGERLALVRLALGYRTQAAIVRALNEIEPSLTPQHWNMWESGRQRIGVDSALLLVRKFNVSLDWIYRGEKDGLPHKLARAIEALEAARE
ncbi:MAG: helix-turn-helix transcriptional regulator [Sphingobacteriales bacterium]